VQAPEPQPSVSLVSPSVATIKTMMTDPMALG
jgi:hypothetical protein